MTAVPIAMNAGAPYIALRDTILAHRTLIEGLIPQFSLSVSIVEPAGENNRAGLKQQEAIVR